MLSPSHASTPRATHPKTRLHAALLTLTLTALTACSSTDTKAPDSTSESTSVSTPTSVSGALTSSGEKMKGSMYWPRLAKNPYWWPEFESGTVTEADIRADLQQMKRDLGVNVVRVFLMYDNQYRENGVIGFTDGRGHFNNARLDTVSRFIDLAASEGLDVLPTLFMEAETTANGGFDWNTLESHYPYHEAYALWLVRMLETKPNVRGVNLKNEPDGFGAWTDPVVAGRILTWLAKLKAAIKTEAPGMGVHVNTAAFDNTFKQFDTAPQGSRSVYEVSDALFFNSYLWADNGFWPYAVPATIYKFIQDRNTRNKPVVLSELGWPAHDDDDGMIVANMQWNLPLGTRPTTPNTPEMQKRAVEESVYWAEKYGFQGVIAWAAFDHDTHAYRNPFGLIDEHGKERPAAAAFAQAFTHRYGRTGEAPLSFADGAVTDGKINGVHGTTPLPAGVNLDTGGAYHSNPLPHTGPVTFTLRVRQPTSPQSDGVSAGLVSATSGKHVQLRREEWNKIWRLYVNDAEVARTKPDAGLGTHARTISASVTKSNVTFSVDGATLTFYALKNNAPYSASLSRSEANGAWKLTANAASTPVELLEMRAHGAALTAVVK